MHQPREDVVEILNFRRRGLMSFRVFVEVVQGFIISTKYIDYVLRVVEDSIPFVVSGRREPRTLMTLFSLIS